MQAVSFSFHELCTPNSSLEREGLHDFNFSAKNFVTQREGELSDFYEVGEKIGSGGYGTVYACVHKTTGIKRAVKKICRLKNGHVTDDAVMREFNILKELDHPNILKQIEMFCDEDHYYIVTEICRGGELLNEIVEWGYLVEEDAVELMRHLLSSVNYCHQNGVAHRDLKPENLLLEEGKDLCDIKVIDFGLAQCVGPDSEMHDIAGSIYYIAPEVLNGSHTHKADIWSCGVIAYIVLAGYAPFDGHNDEEIKEEILSGEFCFDDEIWESVSEQAKDFIVSLLEFDPNARPTAEEALQHPWIVEGRLASSKRLKDRESVTQRAMEALYNLERFTAQSKLKQATCAFIASQLILKEEKQKVDELFRALDISSDGKLSQEDVRIGYKEVFGKELTQEMVEQMFNRIDTDHNGSIEYSEFVVATMNEKDLLRNDKLKHAFNLFDKDGSGRIDTEELIEVLSYFQTVDKTLDGDVIARIVNQVDQNGDGEIGFDEFAAMMFKTAEVACVEEELSKSELNTSGMDLSASSQGRALPEFTVAPPSPLLKKDSLCSIRYRRSDKRASMKACLQLFERTVTDAKDFGSQLWNGTGGNALKRLSARLSFAKIQHRDSKVVMRRAPSGVDSSLRGSSHHTRKCSRTSSSSTLHSFRGSSTENRPASAKARAALYEELTTAGALAEEKA